VEMIYIIVSALVNLYSCLFWPSYVPNHDLVKKKVPNHDDSFQFNCTFYYSLQLVFYWFDLKAIKFPYLKN
jgi:hypothetical protein